MAWTQNWQLFVIIWRFSANLRHSSSFFALVLHQLSNQTQREFYSNVRIRTQELFLASSIHQQKTNFFKRNRLGVLLSWRFNLSCSCPACYTPAHSFREISEMSLNAAQILYPCPKKAPPHASQSHRERHPAKSEFEQNGQMG